MNTIYAHELTGYKKDSVRSLEKYRLRKPLDSRLATMIIFFAMPFYMLFNLSKGKQMTILAGIAMSVMSLTSIYA